MLSCDHAQKPQAKAVNAGEGNEAHNRLFDCLVTILVWEHRLDHRQPVRHSHRSRILYDIGSHGLMTPKKWLVPAPSRLLPPSRSERIRLIRSPEVDGLV